MHGSEVLVKMRSGDQTRKCKKVGCQSWRHTHRYSCQILSRKIGISNKTDYVVVVVGVMVVIVVIVAVAAKVAIAVIMLVVD